MKSLLFFSLTLFLLSSFVPFTEQTNLNWKSNIAMTKYSNQIIKVLTPKGDEVELVITPFSERQQLIKQASTKLVAELGTLVGKMPIYRLPKDNFLIGYTVQDYGLIVGSNADMKRITNNPEYGTISLIKNNDAYYYGYDAYSSFIAKMLKKKFSLLEEYTTNFYQPAKFGGVLQFKAIQFEDKSILHYLERAPGVYQGMWFPSINQFIFYFENNYTG